MSYGVSLKVWGEYACFTRPEFKAERVSYDVITPSAARGLLEAIYWKPAIAWVVDRIRVLNPIRFDTVRRNEVAVQGKSGHKISMGKVVNALHGGKGAVEIFADEERQQRATLLLRDVRYVIEAHFEPRDKDGENSAKHRDIFLRRAAKGQCFHGPYLGCREFPACFEPLDGAPPQPDDALLGPRDLGWMLHDLVYGQDGGREARFFRARMNDGVIEVPPLGSAEVRA